MPAIVYPTVTELKAYAGISSATDDTILGQFLNAAVAHVERETRVFLPATSTKTFPCRYPFIDKARRLLTLYGYDLISITTLTNANSQVITSGHYMLLPRRGPPYYQIELRVASGYVWDDAGTGNDISIAGSWGFGTDVPYDVFVEIMRIANILYRQRGEEAPLPPLKQELVAAYKRGGL